MSQGTNSVLLWNEEFFLPNPLEDTAVADGAAETVETTKVIAVGTASALTLAATVDEPGGILSVDVADNTADDGMALRGPVFKPQDGGVALEVRLKVNDISDSNFYVGFQETVHATVPVMPFTMATTVITVVDTGVTAGIFVDHNADNEDWHFGAAQDTNGAAGVDLTDPAIGDGRAGADLSGAGGDDEWVVVRVEIDTDGTARGYVGSSHLDQGGDGMKFVGETDRGALDATALLTPVIMVETNATAGITTEIDYMRVEGSRDWAV